MHIQWDYLCGNLRIKQIKDEILESNSYIVASSNGNAIVVDPNSYEKINSIMKTEGLIIEMIFLTHEHYDHIAGVNEIKENMKANLICSNRCAKAARSPIQNLSRIFGVQLHFMGKSSNIKVEPYVCAEADTVFEKQHVFMWQGNKIEFTETPGHSYGNCSIMIGENILFTGDALILNHDTIILKKGGSFDDYVKVTIPFFQSKHGECMVFPGHGEIFLLQEGKKQLLEFERKARK